RERNAESDFWHMPHHAPLLYAGADGDRARAALRGLSARLGGRRAAVGPAVLLRPTPRRLDALADVGRRLRRLRGRVPPRRVDARERALPPALDTRRDDVRDAHDGDGHRVRLRVALVRRPGVAGRALSAEASDRAVRCGADVGARLAV